MTDADRGSHASAPDDTASGMTVLDAIRQRRTHKHYAPRPVSRTEIETLLEAAILAPNHKMTEPWRFVVLGAGAKQHYAGIRARLKCGAPTPEGDDERTATKRAKIVAQTLEVPTIIAVLTHLDEDEFRREEDHAAVWMAVQNMLLAATALGLGTKLATGRVFEDAELRALVHAAPDDRVLGVVHVGEPAGERPMKSRTPAADKTRWLD